MTKVETYSLDGNNAFNIPLPHDCEIKDIREDDDYLIIVDNTGCWVIPPQYSRADNFCDGLALVEKDGKLMYIDHSGAVVWEEE